MVYGDSDISQRNDFHLLRKMLASIVSTCHLKRLNFSISTNFRAAMIFKNEWMNKIRLLQYIDQRIKGELIFICCYRLSVIYCSSGTCTLSGRNDENGPGGERQRGSK